jgi:hypothetical protein
MYVAISFRKEERDLLSPFFFFGIEFQRYAPSYIKLVRGCGKQRLLEMFRSLSSQLYMVKRLVSDLGPLLFNNLYMIFAFLPFCYFEFFFKNWCCDHRNFDNVNQHLIFLGLIFTQIRNIVVIDELT